MYYRFALHRAGITFGDITGVVVSGAERSFWVAAATFGPRAEWT